jgi:hypothetical protein
MNGLTDYCELVELVAQPCHGCGYVFDTEPGDVRGAVLVCSHFNTTLS